METILEIKKPHYLGEDKCQDTKDMQEKTEPLLEEELQGTGLKIQEVEEVEYLILEEEKVGMLFHNMEVNGGVVHHQDLQERQSIINQ